MSVTLIAAGIVIVSCAGFVVVGATYEWDIASRGYGRWTRVIGVFALLGLSGTTAWSRADEPLIAAAIALAGVALSVGFVVAHRRLQDRARASLS
jgi:hypothetical protein